MSTDRHNIKVKVIECSHQWSGSDITDEVNKALAELQQYRIIDIKPMMSEYELFYTIIYDKQ